MTIDEAKPLSVGMVDSGEILADGKSAFYRFDNKLSVRDLAIVRLDNQSSTLKPDFKIYDDSKARLFEKTDPTAGASAEQTLTIEPGKSIYVEVLPAGSAGKYKISVSMQNAADQFEPNDDVTIASAAVLGKEISASIMDEKDSDVFKFTAGAKKTSVTVTLMSDSATLKPDIKIYDADKAQKDEKSDANAGANVTFTAPVAPGKDFYIEVLPNGSSGGYKLLVK